MCLEAAQELARCAEDKGLHEDYIVPNMDEWEVFPREAVAVAMKAQEQGVARVEATREELYEQASQTIKAARDQVQFLMSENLIAPLPDS
jgi:malate dehydrogenase (oxaloacetate-decarboxylating)